MTEPIFNLYFVIENDNVVELRYKTYFLEGTEKEKINYLYENAAKDYHTADILPPPRRENGKLMTYEEFSKLEKFSLHFQLFEEVFIANNAPEFPLVCATKVINGKV